MLYGHNLTRVNNIMGLNVIHDRKLIFKDCIGPIARNISKALGFVTRMSNELKSENHQNTIHTAPP